MGGGSHAHTARGQGAVGGVSFDTESRTDREMEGDLWVGGILELERRALGIIHSYSEPGEEQQREHSPPNAKESITLPLRTL